MCHHIIGQKNYPTFDALITLQFIKKQRRVLVSLSEKFNNNAFIRQELEDHHTGVSEHHKIHRYFPPENTASIT